jgi:hypothetical protein
MVVLFTVVNKCLVPQAWCAVNLKRTLLCSTPYTCNQIIRCCHRRMSLDYLWRFYQPCLYFMCEQHMHF